jgi:uncharacterized membrane protein
MKTIFRFLRTTITGGVLFLLPTVLLIILLNKARQILAKLSAPLTDRMPEIVLGLDGSNLAVIAILIFICFLSGLLFRSARVQLWITSLEEHLLVYVPGYSLLKSVAAESLGTDDAHNMTTVLVADGEKWNIGFLVEENTEKCTVFIPESPRHDSGEVKIVSSELVKKVNVTSARAVRTLKTYGKGALEWK